MPTVCRYWRKTLGAEKFDTVSLVPEVGLEAKQDDGRRGAEVKDLGIPLESVSFCFATGARDELTLSKTFSSEFGQSMAKQTKSRSVSGYESGRSLSYSSWPAVSHKASSIVLPVGG